ncbi:MAG TPA: hypothetical protein IAC12_10475 [Candidatus Aphodovivens avistercoris]|nr:hypothetical protein [Candidatus Aphodovivens avistercoris]
MKPYDDILHRAVAGAPWEARSVNGPHHDTADWLGSGVRAFPLPVERRFGDDGAAERGRAQEGGSWGFFELGRGQAGWTDGARTNRWTLDEPPATDGACAGGLAAMNELAALARQGSQLPKAEAKPQLSETEGETAADPDAGLKALAQLRRLARGDADAGPTQGADAERTAAVADDAGAPAKGADDGSACAAGLRALAALRNAARADARRGCGVGAEEAAGGTDGEADAARAAGAVAAARPRNGRKALIALRNEARRRAQRAKDEAEGNATVSAAASGLAQAVAPEQASAPVPAPAPAVPADATLPRRAIPLDDRRLRALRAPLPARQPDPTLSLALPAAEAAPARSPLREPLADAKRMRGEQRVCLVGADDPFAVFLLRACLLAGALAKRPLVGLDGVASAKDLDGCSGVVYLSRERCLAAEEGSAGGGNTDADAAFEAAAAASLAALGAPADGDAAAGARAQGAFVLLDFTGTSAEGPLLPAAFERALREARCVVALAEPGRTELWGNLERTLRGSLEAEAETGGSAEAAGAARTLNAFAVDEAALRRDDALQRFLRAWWAWFGSGARWGFADLASSLERALGLLGFNVHRRSCDLGLLSALAAQLRDGGSVASADDVADALSDRFPNRTLLQEMVDAAMEALLEGPARTEGGSVFIGTDALMGRLEDRGVAPATAAAALRTSPSLQTLLRPEPGPASTGIEVRFSSLFACLAARWFMDDPERSALQVADLLAELARRVPAGGWGSIVLQTALLAEQRGQSFAARVLVERLYAQEESSERKRILVETSLGLFLDTGGKLPALWRDAFLSGSVNARQAQMVAEARASSWLRAENLLVLRRAVDEISADALAARPDDAAATSVLKGCHWADTLLRAAEAPDASALFDQVAADIAAGDEQVARRALGRFDCLAWACLFNVELPCPVWRADALRTGPLEAVGAEALRQLSGPGPAYDECARFAWFYAATCPNLWDAEDWERVRRTAAGIVDECDGNAFAVRRASAYAVLAACTLRATDDGADGAGGSFPLPAATPGPSWQSVEDLIAWLEVEAAAEDDVLHLVMAQPSLGTLSLAEARRQAAEPLGAINLGMVASFERKLFLMQPRPLQLDEDEVQPARSWPSARTRPRTLPPEEEHRLKRGWEEVRAQLARRSARP